MLRLPEWSAVRARVLRILRPRTKWGRVTLWSGGLSAILFALSWVTGSGPDSALYGWATFFGLIFAFCAVWRSVGWAWRHFMWPLRHRLIVTYIFIGVIPILLLLVLAGLGAYLFAGQFATYIAISNLQGESLHLKAANDVLASQLNALDRAGRLDKHRAGEVTTASDNAVPEFPLRTVTVWQGKQGFMLSPGGAPMKALPAKVPDAIKEDFSGLIVDEDSLYLRAVKLHDEGGRRLTVISSVPVTVDVLRSASARLGEVTLIPPAFGDNIGNQVKVVGLHTDMLLKTGRVPPPINRFDWTIVYYTIFNSVDWETGESREGALGVSTRPSMLYSILFSSMGESAQVVEFGLLVVAILVGMVELVALLTGVLLSRSITRAVAELYKATEHVNRGDLTHRIQVRGRDQMAALQQSFNSMSESLVTLLAEQKQKQRMESELTFAYEVQDLLFPHKVIDLTSLDVYGVCRPARSLSGDYYDFIPLSSDRLVLAVGDISGKGIPAALLMATVHAFVRAYSLAPEKAPMPLALEAISNVIDRTNYQKDGVTEVQLSPAALMAALNYQVFRCTPPEKYATMFLGCYDAATRELAYCNAGHLPPILLSADGSVAHLDTSGTVAGLFDGAIYGQSTISMQPGDLFVAFSDGVTEPENDSIEFGEERLIALIQAHRDQPLSRIGHVITDAVAAWIGSEEQPDDVTVVLARAR